MTEAIANTDETVGQAQPVNGMQIEEEKKEVISETIMKPLKQTYKYNYYNEKELESQAIQFNNLMEESKESFYSSKQKIYYLLSLDWIAKLKQYLDLSGSAKSVHPGEFNEDLIQVFLEDIDNKQEYLVNEDRNHYCNIILKNSLIEGKHFIIVNQNLMQFINGHYSGTLIPRMAYWNQGIKNVEVYLKQISVITINQELAKYISKKEVQEFKIKKVQVSKDWTLQEFKVQWGKSVHSFLKQWVKQMSFYYYNWYCNISDDLLRLWMLPQSLDLTEFFASVSKQCQENVGMYSYKIRTDAKHLETDLKQKFNSLCFEQNDYLVVELRDDHQQGWIFVQEGVLGLDKCEGCLKYKQLTCSCKCKKAFYCTEECRERDIKYHSNQCNLAGEISDDDEEALQFNDKSNRGKCGLDNLGNTCFMSSALQCLSNCYPLTEYFLGKKHIKELKIFEQLGRQNPLSSEGNMAKHYGYFLKNMWINENSPFSPFLLKNVIGKKNPHFSGYQQQDSSEFLCFLLDGIHEDLNRVLEKPYSESLDSEDPSEDLLTATKSWYLHKMRNQSIIVDKFHGMLKSRLDCDENCKKISITFDPFLILPLPVPTKKTKSMDVFLVWQDGRKLPVKIQVEYMKGQATIADLIAVVKEEIKGLNELKFVLSGKFRASDMYTLDQQLSTVKKGPDSVNFLIEHEEIDPQETVLKVHLQMTQQLSYYSTAQSHIHILELKAKMNLFELRKQIVRHFRVVLEKVKALGEDQKVIDKIKAMGDEEFYELVNYDSQSNKIEIMWETNSRGYFNCYYCGKNSCKNCRIEEDKTVTLDHIYKKIPYHFDLSIVINFENLEQTVLFSQLTNEYIEYAKQQQSGEEMKVEQEEQQEEQKQGQQQEEEQKQLQEDEESKIPEEKPNPQEEQKIYKMDIEKNNNNNNQSIWLVKEVKNSSLSLQKPGQSIYDCFNAFESLEKLEQGNEWYCNKCQQHKLASKQMKIYSAPEQLIIQLKRFKQGENILSSNKIKTKIDFPLKDLDLTDYVILSEHPNELLIEENEKELFAVTQKQEDLSTPGTKKVKQASAKTVAMNPQIPKKEKILYDLTAVSNHYGNLGFGHYTAYCQNPVDLKWYEFDDRTVSFVEENSIVTEAAYLLFYKRKK